MRRRWLSVAMTFLILAVGLTACDWPQFGLGPAHTGYSASESTLSAANVASVGLSFFSPSGTGPGSSSPVVAGGLAYSVGGSGLLAFDAAGKSGCSGTPARCTPLWSTSAGQTTPAVDSLHHSERQSLRLRRSRADELFRHAQGLQPAVDKHRVRGDPHLSDGLEWDGLRGRRGRQCLRLR
jgi:hypothetical protein